MNTTAPASVRRTYGPLRFSIPPALFSRLKPAFNQVATTSWRGGPEPYRWKRLDHFDKHGVNEFHSGINPHAGHSAGMINWALSFHRFPAKAFPILPRSSAVALPPELAGCSIITPGWRLAVKGHHDLPLPGGVIRSPVAALLLLFAGGLPRQPGCAGWRSDLANWRRCFLHPADEPGYGAAPASRGCAHPPGDRLRHLLVMLVPQWVDDVPGTRHESRSWLPVSR